MLGHGLSVIEARGTMRALGDPLYPIQIRRPVGEPAGSLRESAYLYRSSTEQAADMRLGDFERRTQQRYTEEKRWGAPGAARWPTPARKSGPVRFVETLLRTWRLGPDDAVPLLGFEPSEAAHVRAIMDGRQPLVGRDIKCRIAFLLVIRSTLFEMFRDEDVENEWLRELHPTLDNHSPMALLLDGHMEKFLIVKDYVDEFAGR